MTGLETWSLPIKKALLEVRTLSFYLKRNMEDSNKQILRESLKLYGIKKTSHVCLIYSQQNPKTQVAHGAPHKKHSLIRESLINLINE